MSALSNALEVSLLDHLFRYGTAPYTSPATVYIGLFTADPGEAGATGEVSVGSYARAVVTNDTTNFPPCSGSGTPTKVNGAAFTFPTATAAWGTVTHWAIYDSAVGGTNVMLCHGAFPSPRAVNIGDPPRVSAGALSITMVNSSAGGLTDFSKRKLLDLSFGRVSYAAPATIYTGLATSVSGDAPTECDDSAYDRKATAFSAASSPNGTIANSAEVVYANPAGGNGSVSNTVTHWAIWDDLNSGNVLAIGPLATSRTIAAGDKVAAAITTGIIVTLQ